MKKDYSVIVVGVSAGGMKVLPIMLKGLPKDFPLPVIIVQHQTADSDDFLAQYLNKHCQINVKEADEKEKILAGNVYIAPANYHLLIEKDFTFSLDVSALVNYSRPSIDVLFESAAMVYKEKTIGIVLTGANEDGAKGAKTIKSFNGLVIAQDPNEAEVAVMPLSAIEITEVDYILEIEEIAKKLIEICI